MFVLFLNRAINRHNCRYWLEVHTLHTQKLNVWLKFMVTVLLVLFSSRLQLLQDTLGPALTHILESSERYNEIEFTIQQVGSPPQYNFTVSSVFK